MNVQLAARRTYSRLWKIYSEGFFCLLRFFCCSFSFLSLIFCLLPSLVPPPPHVTSTLILLPHSLVWWSFKPFWKKIVVVKVNINTLQHSQHAMIAKLQDCSFPPQSLITCILQYTWHITYILQAINDWRWERPGNKAQHGFSSISMQAEPNFRTPSLSCGSRLHEPTCILFALSNSAKAMPRDSPDSFFVSSLTSFMGTPLLSKWATMSSADAS